MGDCWQVSKPSRHKTNHPGQLSLAIPPWVSAMITSESWEVNRHTGWCCHISPVSVVTTSQCKLVSGWGLKNRRPMNLVARERLYFLRWRRQRWSHNIHSGLTPLPLEWRHFSSSPSPAAPAVPPAVNEPFFTSRLSSRRLPCDVDTTVSATCVEKDANDYDRATTEATSSGHNTAGQKPAS